MHPPLNATTFYRFSFTQPVSNVFSLGQLLPTREAARVKFRARIYLRRSNPHAEGLRSLYTALHKPMAAKF